MTHAEREKLTRLIEPAVEGLGYELVELSFQREAAGWVLRLFIDFPPSVPSNGHDRPASAGEGLPRGVTLEDCSTVSREVSAVLDVEDPFDHRYTLEVSSPGLDRPLRKLRDFARFVGARARIRMQGPVGGRRNFAGRLHGVHTDEAAGASVEIECDGQVFRLPLAEVARANLEPEVVMPAKPGGRATGN